MQTYKLKVEMFVSLAGSNNNNLCTSDFVKACTGNLQGGDDAATNF